MKIMDAPNKDDRMENLSEFERLLNEEPGYLPKTLRRGEIRNGIILEIREREIIIDLNTKQDGVVRQEDLDRLTEELRDSLKEGDEIPVYVLNPRDQNGNLVVSINMGLQRYDWDRARELLVSEDVEVVLVTGNNRGGILVRWNRLEGFVPSSHLTSAGFSRDRREAWDKLIDQELRVKVIEVDQDRRRLIFSEREAQKEWRAQQKARLLAELEEGNVVKGTVTGLRDFGAFVNLGGADGLIHVSELAWHRVDHPRDVLEIGQEIDVYVLELNRQSNRIALSRKRLLPDPWEDATEQYHEGQLIEGTVTNVVDFGAFVALDNGLEGLLHLSEMGNGALKEPYSYVQKGDRLSLRISHLEVEKRRVGFTQRWGTDAPDEFATGEADIVLLDGDPPTENAVDAEDVPPASDYTADDDPEGDADDEANEVIDKQEPEESDAPEELESPPEAE
jgi:small subunit ribosomal protein S1